MRLNRRLTGAALALAIAAIAFGIATLGAPRVAADAPCLAPNTCGPDSPLVICSNHRVYANICQANQACQYDCRPILIAR